MSHIALLSVLLIQCISSEPQPSLREWLSERLATNPAPLAYVIRLENEQTLYPNFKSKRSITESIETDKESFIAAFVKRPKRTATNASESSRSPRSNVLGPPPMPKEVQLKANLRYHHQQRHPNGSVTGSYAQMDPQGGQLRVTHYVNDEKGFREYPEGSEASIRSIDPYQPTPSGNINIVTNSNNGILPPDSAKHNRRGINPLDGSNINFVPNINPQYSLASPIGGISPTPILQSAAGSVNQFSPRSPLFDKYYRPTPDEVQRSYEYHRIRSSLDPNSFRPTDMTPIPDIPRDKQPELRSVYSEYQIPYTIRSQDENPNGYYAYNNPQDPQQPPYAQPLLPLGGAGAPIPLPQDIYAKPGPYQPNQYPPLPYQQPVEPQNPIYMQSYDGQAFIPASTYSGPYVPSTPTFNHPYPTNIPIYNTPVPQNVAVYAHPPPENIPVYVQPQPAVPINGQNVYYASASGPQPTVTTKQ